MRCDADAAHLSDNPFGVVVLIGANRFLVGTGNGSRHRLGGIPLPGARSLGDAAVDDQGMAVVHEHVPPVAGQCRVSIGLADQQSVGIRAGAVSLVAELDTAEITLVAPPRSAFALGKGTLLAFLGYSKILTRF